MDTGGQDHNRTGSKDIDFDNHINLKYQKLLYPYHECII